MGAVDSDIGLRLFALAPPAIVAVDTSDTSALVSRALAAPRSSLRRSPTPSRSGEPCEGGGMESPAITDQTRINRRTVIGGALAALTPLVLPGRVWAQGKAVPDDSFVVLLKGLYQPVVRGPNLGLSTVDLSDGSYSVTKICPVNGTPGNKDEDKAVGDFYTQLEGDLCAYHIPGGSFSMRFTGENNFVFVDDGQGGRFLEGTFELTILEATGNYRRFGGGHNHMVDKLHLLPPGDGSGRRG